MVEYIFRAGGAVISELTAIPKPMCMSARRINITDSD